MPMGILFWVLMVIWFVFGLWLAWPITGFAIGGHLLMFILFAILGWKTFGPVIQ